MHIPDNGADTFQADYHIYTGTANYHRTVNQRWNKNVWVDLGSFQLSAGAKVWLTNCFESLTVCTTPGFTMSGDPAPLTTYEPTVIDGLSDDYTTLFQAIHYLAPNARIVAVGYPHVITTGTLRNTTDCRLLSSDTIQWFAQMADRLDGVFAPPRGTPARPSRTCARSSRGRPTTRRAPRTWATSGSAG